MTWTGAQRRLVSISAVAMLSIGALTTWGSGVAAGQDDGKDAGTAGGGDVSAQDVEFASAGPLTNIWITSELNCQVKHEADETFQFFPASEIVGACGTLVAVDGTLYRPSALPAGGDASPFTAFTTVSQTPITGSGTEGDPFQVVTVVTAGPLLLTETDTYVVGTQEYRTSVMVTNTSAEEHDFVLYRAGDCFLAGTDDGFGELNLATGEVTCVGSDDGGVTPSARIERWVPLTAGSTAYEAEFDAVWAWIGTQQPFNNTCLCDDFIDNGAGISWVGSLAAGASATYAHLTIFAPLGLDEAVEPPIEEPAPPPPPAPPVQAVVRFTG